MTWTLQLPVDSLMTLNQRLHWAVKARKTADLRAAARYGARNAGIPVSDHLHLTLHYRPRDRRHRDADNLMASFKPAADGVRDACLADDTPDFLSWSEPVIHEPAAGRKPALWLVVEAR